MLAVRRDLEDRATSTHVCIGALANRIFYIIIYKIRTMCNFLSLVRRETPPPAPSRKGRGDCALRAGAPALPLTPRARGGGYRPESLKGWGGLSVRL
jgi:hypothetical protein